jgi:hypothetical protein
MQSQFVDMKAETGAFDSRRFSVAPMMDWTNWRQKRK